MLENVGWLPSRIDVKYDDIIAKKPAFKAFLVNDPAYQAYYYPPTGIHDEIATKFADRLAKAYPGYEPGKQSRGGQEGIG